MKIDSDSIKQLAALLDETGLAEIEVADGDRSIRVSKSAAVMSFGGAQAQPVNVMDATGMSSDPTTPQVASTDAPNLSAGEHPGAITSPMVGTAYLQPEPGAAPFVQKGDSIKAGDTLVIIEAMKVMNPIKSEKSGTVTRILIENGQPVEFGDVLMVVE